MNANSGDRSSQPSYQRTAASASKEAAPAGERRFCNKCGYFGPDAIHKRPRDDKACGYLSCRTSPAPAQAREPSDADRLRAICARWEEEDAKSEPRAPVLTDEQIDAFWSIAVRRNGTTAGTIRDVVRSVLAAARAQEGEKP